MADEWFYARNGEKHGPIPPNELGQMAKDGRLLPTDLIWKAGMANWVPASGAKGLFPTVSSSAPTDQPQIPDSISVAVEQVPQASPTQSVGASLKTRAAEAARCARATAERTQLVTVALPRAHAELGKALFKEGSRKEDFPELFAAVESLLSQRRQIQDESKARPTASGLAEKAKKAAADAAAMARIKALDLQALQAFAKLGDAAYQKHGKASGPTSVVQAIESAAAKRDQLDAELAAMETGAKGRWLTPKRIMWGTAICLGLSVWSAMFGPREPKETSSSSESSQNSTESRRGDSGGGERAVSDEHPEKLIRRGMSPADVVRIMGPPSFEMRSALPAHNNALMMQRWERGDGPMGWSDEESVVVMYFKDGMPAPGGVTLVTGGGQGVLVEP